MCAPSRRARFVVWRFATVCPSRWKSSTCPTVTEAARMPETTLDQALPILQKLAERKAGAFVHRFRFAADEREDVASQLVLTTIRRWTSFDSERGSVQTFASKLMDRELISILRYRSARRRQ